MNVFGLIWKVLFRFRSILFLISLQLCELVKLCSDMKRFVPKIKICSVFSRVFVPFCPYLNTNVSTCKVLYQIQKCFFFFRSVLFLISIQMSQLIKFCSVYRRVMFRISLQMCQLIRVFFPENIYRSILSIRMCRPVKFFSYEFVSGILKYILNCIILPIFFQK